ncbi:ATP-binding protein [Egibacter rhizosphaerae]|uniref:ATP-binding protein n=1 Tax=Egibacter rhizosphaerae TaxID=1670831 RepID=A0A411YCI5_9ACTN|nr:YifB family Mg chelatase-like AAA ATPase [Egibacter rhizosphaerae]QBI18963.1 ATP-binding protein [Egibacter rhizosphaerae]
MSSGAKVARARAVTLIGLDAHAITVEAEVTQGLPGFSVLGASGSAGREAADRVRAALAAAGCPVGARKVLTSLAPAELPKVGARFDLALAVAVLARLEVLPPAALEGVVLLGELALDGAVRSVPGVLPSLAALESGDRLLVADDDAAEAAVSGGSAEIVPISDLGEAVAVLRGRSTPRRAPEPTAIVPPPVPDLADVQGQHEARRALEVAAAGGHHLLFVGPPGCGKSMLAERLPGLLPSLDADAALQLAAIRSVAGLLDPGRAAVLDTRPPFRAPHHGTTQAALLGGGSGIARPGEVSLAHRGALLVDELLEWPRRLLDGLREPLQEGVVRVARSRATVRYPAAFQLIAATNPCPCGSADGCRCSVQDLQRYRQRLSGPLVDRLDLAPAVRRLAADDVLTDHPAERSAEVAERVAAARRTAEERSATANADAPIALLRASCGTGARQGLAQAVDAGVLTGRGHDRALRVARTLADLDGRDRMDRADVDEALGHRLALLAVEGADR